MIPTLCPFCNKSLTVYEGRFCDLQTTPLYTKYSCRNLKCNNSDQFYFYFHNNKISCYRFCVLSNSDIYYFFTNSNLIYASYKDVAAIYHSSPNSNYKQIFKFNKFIPVNPDQLNQPFLHSLFYKYFKLISFQ